MYGRKLWGSGDIALAAPLVHTDRLSTNGQIAPLDCVLKNSKDYQEEVMRKVQGNTDQLSTNWKTVPFDFVLNKYKRIQEVFTKVLENTGRLSTNRQLVTSCSQLWIVFRKVLKITNWYWQPSCIIQTNCEKTVCQPLEQLLANFAFGFCLEKDEYYSSLVDNWSALLYSHYNLIIFFNTWSKGRGQSRRI